VCRVDRPLHQEIAPLGQGIGRGGIVGLLLEKLRQMLLRLVDQPPVFAFVESVGGSGLQALRHLQVPNAGHLGQHIGPFGQPGEILDGHIAVARPLQCMDEPQRLLLGRGRADGAERQDEAERQKQLRGEGLLHVSESSSSAGLSDDAGLGASSFGALPAGAAPPDPRSSL